MARDRLNDTPESGRGPMSPGDVRIVHVKDGQGQIVNTLTIHRTNRPYAYDLVDAYNAARLRHDVEWFVNASGDPQLGDAVGFNEQNTKRLERKAERERQEWLRNNQARPRYGDDSEEAA